MPYLKERVWGPFKTSFFFQWFSLLLRRLDWNGGRSPEAGRERLGLSPLMLLISFHLDLKFLRFTPERYLP